MGGICFLLGQYSRAEALARHCLATVEELWGSEHPEVAGALSLLGLAHLKQDRASETREHLERALEIREKALGRRHPEVEQTQKLLAGLSPNVWMTLTHCGWWDVDLDELLAAGCRLRPLTIRCSPARS